MGSVIGKTLSAENGLSPAYDLLGKSGGYELRTYLSYVVAEVQASNEPGKEDDCFRTLAKVGACLYVVCLHMKCFAGFAVTSIIANLEILTIVGINPNLCVLTFDTVHKFSSMIARCAELRTTSHKQTVI